MVDKEQFLRKHFDKIVQNTRTPVVLADRLLAKGFINQEMYEKIETKETKSDKNREIHASLNSKTHFDFMYDWLKENEPHLFEELGKSLKM